MQKKFDAIVFDFDGVLVESTDVKTSAFAAIYAEFGPKIQQQVVAHHLANNGIARHIKFRHYHENLLGIPCTSAAQIALSERFSALVVDAVVSAPYVIGALEFLERFYAKLPLFVASGTPEVELLEIIRRRGMQHYFAAIHGSPATKAEILNSIIQRHRFSANRVLMIGDAIADLDGARCAGTAFIARSSPDGPSFPSGVVTISDLTNLPALI